ncbi:MAG: hypothetical protein V4732_00310 [Pseudomonadota bacterium]
MKNIRWFLLVVFTCVIAGCGGSGGKSDGVAATSISLDKTSLSFTAATGQAAPAQIVNVTYKGDGVVVGFAPGVAQPNWIVIEQQSASATSVTFSIATNNLAPLGTFTSTIRFVTGQSDGTLVKTVDLPVTLRVSQSSGSSSSISSSSSSASYIGADAATIFIDQLDPVWNELIGWEVMKDNSISAEYSDGTQAALVHWAIVPSLDQGHNNVIDVQFTDNTDYNGLIRITTMSRNDVDMSEFSTGKLVFDIKLVNPGNFSPSLSLTVECEYPCSSRPLTLAIPSMNQWVTQEIAITDLISSGLDTSKVNRVFQIAPYWNNQMGVNFQLDNIRWEKGDPSVAAPSYCYRQPFESLDLAYHLDWLNGSPAVISNVSISNYVWTYLTPNWASTTDKFGYAPDADDIFAACAFANATLSAQIYLSKTYVDDGKMQLGFYYEDSSQRRAYFAPVSAATLKPDDWTIIRSDLTPYNGITLSPFISVDASFDSSSITNVGIYFDANGKSASVIGRVGVDNIDILKK